MTEGYKSKEYGVPTKRFVQTMDLKDDSELIRKYREAHDREHFWDEIKAGIKTVGILDGDIHLGQPTGNDSGCAGRLRLGHGYGTPRYPAPPGGMGEACG